MAVMRVQLLDNNKTVADSGWLDASGFGAGYSVVIQGIVSGDTLDVRVSNQPTAPAADNIGVIYGSSITADGIVKIAETYGWIKVRRTAITGGGTVSAHLAAARPPVGRY